MQTDEFDCPAEETMSQCGVDGNAKLFVRVVEPLPEDELYEEDQAVRLNIMKTRILKSNINIKQEF